ncbi:hypothetical protein [uncultured Maribacter sp.]|uniref:hypothetical protein n=1 Tax=uncultured Maribacter sp. TaxID=431308 RepID=UPI0026152203|nr:hypothetical protein [uncultured Maribacter sp.]
MQKIAVLFVFILFSFITTAQDGALFDYEIERIDGNNYELKLQVSGDIDIQYIQIHFLEKGKSLDIYEASLNKKRDGRYYLFFKGEENQVFLDNVEFKFTHNYGLLSEPSVIVKLIDKDFKVIDSYQKNID